MSRSSISRIAVVGSLVLTPAILASPASADPTQPGTAHSAGAVYGVPPQEPQLPDVLGETPPTPTVDEPGPTPLGETPDTASPTSTPTPVADQVGAAERDVRSIPFTGFAALVVLGIGVALIAGGAILRVAVRPRDAVA